MKAKEYMRMYQAAEREVRRLTEELEQIRADAEAISAPMDGERVATSGVSDRVGRGAVRAADLSRMLEAKREYALQVKINIINTIERIRLSDNVRDRSYKEQNYKDLLKYVYVDGKKLIELPDIMYVDYRTITRWHGHALQAIDVQTCPMMSHGQCDKV